MYNYRVLKTHQYPLMQSVTLVDLPVLVGTPHFNQNHCEESALVFLISIFMTIPGKNVARTSKMK